MEPGTGDKRNNTEQIPLSVRQQLEAAGVDPEKVEKLRRLQQQYLEQEKTGPKEYVAPRSSTERKLQEIWGSVLDIENPGVHDNFFDLGGTSLKAIMLNAKVKEEFGVDFSSVMVYEHLTIASQVAYLEEKPRESNEREEAVTEDWMLIKDKIKRNRLRQKNRRGV